LIIDVILDIVQSLDLKLSVPVPTIHCREPYTSEFLPILSKFLLEQLGVVVLSGWGSLS
jgi:hypothetical protein